MKWKKLSKEYKVELFHDVDLVVDGKVLVSVNKENPIKGVSTHYAYKKIGNNNVQFWNFLPDISPEHEWSFSRKWLRIVKEDKS